MKPLKISLDFLLRKSQRNKIKKTENPKKKALSGAERARRFRQKKQNDATYIKQNKTKMVAYHKRERERRTKDQAYAEKKREYERVRKAEQRAKKQKLEENAKLIKGKGKWQKKTQTDLTTEDPNELMRTSKHLQQNNRRLESNENDNTNEINEVKSTTTTTED